MLHGYDCLPLKCVFDDARRDHVHEMHFWIPYFYFYVHVLHVYALFPLHANHRDGHCFDQNFCSIQLTEQSNISYLKKTISVYKNEELTCFA